MKRYIQAVNANVRRYTTPASLLNAELTAVNVREMLQSCTDGVWTYSMDHHVGGKLTVDATISGESALLSRFRTSSKSPS